MNYKKIIHYSLVIFLVFAIALPSISLAVFNEETKAQRDAKREEIQTKKTEKTCTIISNQAKQIQKRLTERIANLTQKRNEIEENIQQRNENRLAVRTENREDLDEIKEANWEKLKAKAQTDEQKEAVEKFILAVQEAVKVKREAIDALITEFKTGIQNQHAERKTQTDSALSTYEDALSSIVTQVEKDCQAGKDARETREYFKTEMKKAREEFHSNLKAVEKFRDAFAPIKEAKKSEIQEIKETFKASIETAKNELRTAFPISTEN